MRGNGCLFGSLRSWLDRHRAARSLVDRALLGYLTCLLVALFLDLSLGEPLYLDILLSCLPLDCGVFLALGSAKSATAKVERADPAKREEASQSEDPAFEILGAPLAPFDRLATSLRKAAEFVSRDSQYIRIVNIEIGNQQGCCQ